MVGAVADRNRAIGLDWSLNADSNQYLAGIFGYEFAPS
jgi:hypothetical protein